MTVVAIVAIILTATIMVRRSLFFRGQATVHAEQERHRKHLLSILADDPENYLKEEQENLKLARSSDGPVPNSYWLDAAAKSRRRSGESRERLKAWVLQSDYHAQLKRQYERAAVQPWVSVPPDPPEPPYPLFGDPMPSVFVVPSLGISGSSTP
jgi:hypothetical protein